MASNIENPTFGEMRKVADYWRVIKKTGSGKKEWGLVFFRHLSYNRDMVTTLALDTLTLAEDFAKAGFDEKEARILAEKLGELANGHLVTREYLDAKLDNLDHKVDDKVQRLEHKMEKIQWQITLALGGWLVAVLTFFELMNRFFSA